MMILNHREIEENREKEMILTLFMFVLLLALINLIWFHYDRSKLMKFSAYERRDSSSKPRKRIRDNLPRNQTSRMEDFDWLTYIELYIDLQQHNVSTRSQAVEHYQKFGRFEGRVYPRYNPDKPNHANGIEKLSRYVNDMAYLGTSQVQQNNKKGIKPILIIYNIENFQDSDTAYNNLQIFLVSIKQYLIPIHKGDSVQLYSVFIWINVIETMRTYELENFVSKYLNIDAIRWDTNPSSIYSHLRTLKLLQSIIEIKFSSVLFLSNSLRGPLTPTNNLDWIASLQPAKEKKYVVRAVFPCDKSAKTVALNLALDGLSITTNLISRLPIHQNFESNLLFSPNSEEDKVNALLFSPLEQFVVFNGSLYPYNTKQSFCNPPMSSLFSRVLPVSTHYNQEEKLQVYQEQYPEVKLRMPELKNKGTFYSLYQQFSQEVRTPIKSSTSIEQTTPNCSQLQKIDKEKEEVICFLVRSCSIHHMNKRQRKNPYEQIIEMGIKDIISSKFSSFFFFLKNFF